MPMRWQSHNTQRHKERNNRSKTIPSDRCLDKTARISRHWLRAPSRFYRREYVAIGCDLHPDFTGANMSPFVASSIWLLQAQISRNSIRALPRFTGANMTPFGPRCCNIQGTPHCHSDASHKFETHHNAQSVAFCRLDPPP